MLGSGVRASRSAILAPIALSAWVFLNLIPTVPFRVHTYVRTNVDVLSHVASIFNINQAGAYQKHLHSYAFTSRLRLSIFTLPILKIYTRMVHICDVNYRFSLLAVNISTQRIFVYFSSIKMDGEKCCGFISHPLLTKCFSPLRSIFKILLSISMCIYFWNSIEQIIRTAMLNVRVYQ